MLFYYCGLKSHLEVKVSLPANQVVSGPYRLYSLFSSGFIKKQIDKRVFFFHRVSSRFKRHYEFFGSNDRSVTEVSRHRRWAGRFANRLSALPITDWRSVDVLPM